MTTPHDAGVPTRARRQLSVWTRWAIATGALLLVVAVGVHWRLSGDDAVTNAGAFPTWTSPSPSSGPSGTEEIPIASGGLPVVTPVRPVRLRVVSIGIEPRITPVGITSSTGEVDVPRSVDTVGWYRFGADLGATAGSIVIAGHVDSAAQGPGAFFRLRDVKPGATVTVVGDDGVTRTFTVVSREVFAKTVVPLDRLFARDGPVRLTLITCGGSFDSKTRQYRDNVVLTALPK